MAKELTYEIKETVGVLSDNNGLTIECNVISFNGNSPKIDIRKWDRRVTPGKMWKGVSLTLDEARVLCELLSDWLEDKEALG